MDEYSKPLTAIGAEYPYSKEELNEKMDDLTELINSGADPSNWREVTPDEWTEFYKEIHVNRFVPEYKSFGEAASDGLRRMRKRHGIEKPISVKKFAVTKPKDDQLVKPAPQETVQAEVKPEPEPETKAESEPEIMPETTDAPEIDSGSSAEDATVPDEPEVIDDEPVLSEPEAEPEEVEAEEPESELEPPEGLSKQDRAEWIMRKLFQKEGSIPNTRVLAKATGSNFQTLYKWFSPWWEWPERFGVDWSSEMQRTKAKAAKAKAAAEEAAKAAAAAATAAASNIDEEVEEIEPIEEELPVGEIETEDVGDDKPDEPSDEPVDSDDKPEESVSEESDDESEEDLNEEVYYSIPPGFEGEITFRFNNVSDEDAGVWLYFSKLLEAKLNVTMNSRKEFTTNDG